MLSIPKSRDYRLLFLGQAISQMGDQFHLLALPWLVLTLTEDPLQLGLLLAMAGMPRAVFMLAGGAWADRCSPRTIMFVSDALRFIITAALAAAVVTGAARMWMIYVLALTFGIVSAFFTPAAQSVVPRLLDDSQLESGHSIIQGTNHLAGFLGPVLAGLLIALFAGPDSAGSPGAPAALLGIGAAFALDACSFLVSGLCIGLMARQPSATQGTGTHPWSDILEGVQYAWGSLRIRWMVLLIACANFLVAGPVFVGIPVLAQRQLDGGPAALGIAMSACGLGSLAGVILGAATSRPSDRAFSWLVVALFTGFAAVMGSLGLVRSTWLAATLLFATGAGNGYAGLLLMTSVQRSTDNRFLGRVMSLITLAGVGLFPVSQAVAGVILKVAPAFLFLGSGTGFLILALVAFAKRSCWSLQRNSVDPGSAFPSMAGVGAESAG